MRHAVQDDEETPEPCPATFDAMAQRLQVWRSEATLDRWMAEGEAATARTWAGCSRIVRGGNRGAVAVEAPTKRVQTWQELCKRIGVELGESHSAR